MAVFDPHLHLKTITIVGVGGTGSQVARIVGRMLYDMKRRGLHIPDLVLIDPDCVEIKNVGRQLFTAGDVGQYKAHTISKRLNLGLGLNSVAIAEPVSLDHFERYSGHLIVSCVDNHAARKVLHEIDGLHISAGNHHASGQVCIGNSSDVTLIKRTLDRADGKIPYLPKEGLLFPALLEPEPDPAPDTTLSCADLVLAGAQDIIINDWVSVVVGQYIHKILYREPIETFLSFISADTLTIRSLPVCKSEVEAYLP